MNLIAHCQDSGLRYWGADRPHRGVFYVGVDFGKKRDHSVVAVVERVKNHYFEALSPVQAGHAVWGSHRVREAAAGQLEQGGFGVLRPDRRR